jgi:hypothetical protein
MATVINSPRTDDASGVGVIVGIIIALAIIVLAALYFVPAIRGGNAGTGTEDSGGTQINVPDQVDLNLNNGGGAPAPAN